MNKLKKISEYKELMKQHLNLKLYIMYMGFSAVIFIAVGEMLAGFVLTVFMFLGLILHEKYKERLHLD